MKILLIVLFCWFLFGCGPCAGCDMTNAKDMCEPSDVKSFSYNPNTLTPIIVCKDKS